MEEKTLSQVLIKALHYVKSFRGQVFVIKLGGEVMCDERVMDCLAEDLVLLNSMDIKPVVVHGGGRDISDAMKRFGKVPEFVEGLRVTDAETMDIVKMVLIGKINTGIVAKINKQGGSAVGLSGKSGKLFMAQRRKQKIDLGFVGDITEVNTELVSVLLEKNYIPVISPVGFDSGGDSLNINADTAASRLAVSLGASKLVFMTSVEGVLDKKNKLISKLTVKQAKKLIAEGTASAGMIPKLEACIHSVEGGVARAHIIKSREHAFLQEVLTSKGTGSMVYLK
ncbi:MAG: acetylglutamate kinase [Candidatus Altiarchaeales archaeon ex4484_96]|nr:MAG: acetylglutamate kinase [Candidatus Altiarchaeales archaeon ex4484_96]